MKKTEDLRSARWFAPDDLRSFGHRSRAMQMGLDGADWEESQSSQSSTPGLIYHPATTICAIVLVRQKGCLSGRGYAR